MKLYEHEGKYIFREMGIPTPRGIVAKNLAEAEAAALEIGYPVVVKSQVLSGGRGKAGGIKFANNSDELAQVVEALFKLELSGEKVETLLIEEKLQLDREFYMGITLDPQALQPVLMISAQGGMDIEEVAAKYPDKLFKIHLDPLNPVKFYQAMDIVLQTGLTGSEMLEAAKILEKLVAAYFKYNAMTAEINPLIIDQSGKVLAGDSKFEIDDSAIFRVKHMVNFDRKEDPMTPFEAEAKEVGLTYVGLESGNIGLIAGGAGIGMASMDMIFAHGGAPANFLDLGGGATLERTATALRLVLKTPGVEGVLINVFGGINNCEIMAKGICQVVDELKPSQTIVVKMRGHSQEEGWALLEARNIPIVKFGTTEEAVLLLFEEMKKRGNNSGSIS